MIKKKVYFVTSNKGKFNWAKKMLVGFGINLIQKDIDMDETRDLEVEKVALHKGSKIASDIDEPFFVEDTGFYIKSLNNFPSTHIKFITSTIGLNGILKLMENKNDRNVVFRSALVFFDSKKNIKKTFVCDDIGILSKNICGENTRGFSDLMKIFIPLGFNTPAANLSDLEFAEYEKGLENKDHYLQFARWFENQYD